MDVTVELEEETFQILQRRAEENGFESTAAYCETALKILSEEIELNGGPDEAVSDRLEDLGYLN